MSMLYILLSFALPKCFQQCLDPEEYAILFNVTFHFILSLNYGINHSESEEGNQQM